MIDSITKSTDQKYWLEAYAQYLKNVRNLTFNTRRRYLFVVGKLLHGLSPDGQIDSTKFSPDAICAFVTREAEARIGAGKRSCTSPVRSFLRFLVGQGVLRQGTESVIPRVRFREENRLPKYLTEQEVRDILKVSVQQSSRNYAVLLLLSRLGLRAHEVSGLLLSDIEWTNGSLVIRGKKNALSTLTSIIERTCRCTGDLFARREAEHFPSTSFHTKSSAF
jgi:site-specific recombinase XerD